jgi:hypothetical protein
MRDLALSLGWSKEPGAPRRVLPLAALDTGELMHEPPLPSRCNGGNEITDSDQFYSHAAQSREWNTLRLCRSDSQGDVQMVSEIRQHAPAQQKSGYFGVITIILIVAAGLFWGFAHI